MKAFIATMVLVGLAAYVAAQDPTKGEQGTCQCAAFKDETDGAGEPIVSKTPGFKVGCEPEGAEDCKKMCIALAEAAKEKVPKVLCETLKTHIENLKPAAFYKACDAPEWSYTGLTATEPICCHEGMVAVCA